MYQCTYFMHYFPQMLEFIEADHYCKYFFQSFFFLLNLLIE
jgi:hypothetical protein